MRRFGDAAVVAAGGTTRVVSQQPINPFGTGRAKSDGAKEGATVRDNARRCREIRKMLKRGHRGRERAGREVPA